MRDVCRAYLEFVYVFPQRAEPIKKAVRPATLAQLIKAEQSVPEPVSIFATRL